MIGKSSSFFLLEVLLKLSYAVLAKKRASSYIEYPNVLTSSFKFPNT